jgi:hypothetical protein
MSGWKDMKGRENGDKYGRSLTEGPWRKKMLIYKVFYKNFVLKKAELLGVLLERRKDMRGKSQIESGLKWAKLTFGRLVKDTQSIFVVPNELKVKDETKWLLEKGILNKEEYLEMMKVVDQEMKEKEV